MQLPNDYRALLTICDGLTLWDHTFFGTVDYKNQTELAKSARRYLEMSASYGRPASTSASHSRTGDSPMTGCSGIRTVTCAVARPATC